MMPLNHIFRRCTGGYKRYESQEKIYNLIYKDDVKQFDKNEKELETLIYTIRIYSENIGIKLGIEKCVMPIMKSGK